MATLVPSKAIFESNDYRVDRVEYVHCPITKRVLVTASGGNFIDRYLGLEIGVYLYFHTMPVANQPKPCDYILSFQKVGLDNFHLGDSHTCRTTDLGTGVKDVSADHVKSPMPVFACPVIQNANIPVNVLGEFA